MARNYVGNEDVYSGSITGITLNDGAIAIPVTVTQGRFTKIGDMVSLYLYFSVPDLSSMTSTNNLYIGSIPIFDKDIVGDTVGTCRIQYANKSSANSMGYCVRTSGIQLVICEIINGGISPYVDVGQYNQGGSSLIELSISYYIG